MLWWQNVITALAFGIGVGASTPIAMRLYVNYRLRKLGIYPRTFWDMIRSQNALRKEAKNGGKPPTS